MRWLLVVLLLVAVVPLAFAGAGVGILGDRVIISGLFDVGMPPGKYPLLLLPLPGTEIGAAYLPDVNAWVSLVFESSSDRALFPDGYFWSGFYFMRCPESCTSDDIRAALSQRLGYGSAVGNVIVARYESGGLYVIAPVYGTYYDVYPRIYIEFPDVVVDVNGSKVAFFPYPGWDVRSISKKGVVVVEHDYKVQAPASRFAGRIKFRVVTEPYTAYYFYTLYVSPDGGVYLASGSDVKHETNTWTNILDLLNTAGRCNFTSDAFTGTYIRNVVGPVDVVLPGRELGVPVYYRTSYECSGSEGFYPFFLESPVSRPREVAVSGVAYRRNLDYQYLIFMLEPAEVNYLGGYLESSQLGVLLSDFSRVKSIEENRVPVRKKECFVDVPPKVVDVVDVEGYSRLHPYDDAYPKRFTAMIRFPSECVLSHGVDVVLMSGDFREELEDVNIRCTGYSCRVDVSVPVLPLKRFYVYLIDDVAGRQYLLFSHVLQGRCLEGMIHIDVENNRVMECGIRCGPGGCDAADRLTYSSLTFSAGGEVDKVDDLWHFDLLGALLYGAMGTAASVLDNIPTITEVAAMGGLPVVFMALVVGFGLFVAGYYIASRCLKDKGMMNLWVFGTIFMAPFFGSLGSVGAAILGCIASKLAG